MQTRIPLLSLPIRTTVLQRLWSRCRAAGVLALLCLLGVGWLSAADGGAWVVPSGFQDPENKWVSEPQAYDESTASYADDHCNRSGDGPWLNLTHTTPIATDRVQIIADFGYNIVDSISLEADIAGTWTPIYTGIVLNDAASVIQFPAITTNAFRFRFHYVVNGYYFWLYDFRSFKVPDAISPPAIFTIPASSVTESTAVLHGRLGSDGGAPCTVRFQYRLSAGTDADYVSTVWQGGVTSGEGSNLVLSSVSGLQPGASYTYRVQAENTVSLVTGDPLTFTPVPIQPGTVGWVSASGVTAASLGEMVWSNPVCAIDDDVATATRCYHPLWEAVTSPSLEFTLPPIATDYLRLMAGKNDYIDRALIEVQAFGSTTWTSVPTTDFADRTWVYAPLPSRIVYSKARVRFTTTTTGVGTAWELYEMQVRVPPTTDIQVSFAPGANQTVSSVGRYTLPLHITSSVSDVPVVLTLTRGGTMPASDWLIAGASGNPLQLTIPAGQTDPVIEVDVISDVLVTPKTIDLTMWNAPGVTVLAPTSARIQVNPYVPLDPYNPQQPTILPYGGIFNPSVQVTLAAPGATAIYYTTNGKLPTTKSAKYKAPVTFTKNTRLRVMAYYTRIVNRAKKYYPVYNDATFNVGPYLPDPVFSPDDGIYTLPQQVSITCPAVGADVRYTTNGSDPVVTSALATGPINVATTTTIKARAFKTGVNPSEIVWSEYHIDAPPIIAVLPESAFVPGPTRTLTVLGDDDHGEAALRYTWTCVSGPSLPIFASGNGTNAAKSQTAMFPLAGRYLMMATVKDVMNQADDGYCVVDVVDVGSQVVEIAPAGGVYTAEFDATITAPESTVVRYRTDGGVVTVDSPLVSGSVHVDRGMTLVARAFTAVTFNGVTYAYGGEPVTQAYTMQLLPPTMMPPGGAVSFPVSVTILGPSGATNRYTTDGSDPNAFSPIASGAIAIAGPTTLRARSFRTGWVTSPATSAVYTAGINHPPEITQVSTDPWGPVTMMPFGPVILATAHVTANDPDTGTTGLTYYWDAPIDFDGMPNHLSVTGNGIEGTLVASGVGVWPAWVMVSDPQGLSTYVEFWVTVNSVPIEVTVSPASAIVPISGTQNFSALVTDQFGDDMSAPVQWGVSGGGTISPSGIFTASMAGGPFTVTATAGGKTGTAQVTVSNPAPTITTAPAADSSPVISQQVGLSVLGADDGGEPNLTYTWSATGTPPATVVFTPNGTNAAKNTMATFSQAGTYAFQVTITNASGLSVVGTIPVAVDQGLASIVVAPATTFLALGQSQAFTATGLDQFGLEMATQPTWTWSTSGGGAMSTEGVFTGSAVGGPYTIIASGIGVSASAVVTVNSSGLTVLPLVAAMNPLDNRQVILTATATAGSDIGTLTYTWLAVGSGFDGPTFSVNGTSSANSTVAQVPHAGTWQFQVTVTDGVGGSAVATVSIPVISQVSQVAMNLGTATLPVAGQLAVSAVWTNQFGDTVTCPADATWTTNAGRVIENRLLLAGSHGGAFPITVASGVVSATGSVTVLNGTPSVVGGLTVIPSGTGAYLEVAATDDGGPAQLTYSWTVSGGSVGATVAGTDPGRAVLTTPTAGTWICTVVVTDAEGASITQAVPVTTVSVPQSLAIQSDTTNWSSGMVTCTPMVADAWGASMPTTGIVWSASAGTINSASGIATADGTGILVVTATLGNLVASASFDPSLPGGNDNDGNGSDQPTPVMPQIVLQIVDGLTGDRTGSEDGESVSYTNLSSVTVNVTASGGNVAITNVTISGGSDGSVTGSIGAQSVSLAEGVNHLVATVTVDANSSNGTVVSAPVAIMCDLTPPTVYLGQPTAVDGQGKPLALPSVAVCYLNGMSEADNATNYGTAWTVRKDRFARDTYQIKIVAVDDRSLSRAFDNGIVVTAQASVSRETAVLVATQTGSLNDPKSKIWKLSGFDRLKETEVFGEDYRGSPRAGIHTTLITIADRCGNVANIHAPAYWVKTIVPKGVFAYIPAGSPYSAMVPENRASTYLWNYHWVLADGDVINTAYPSGNVMTGWGGRCAEVMSEKPPAIVNIGTTYRPAMDSNGYGSLAVQEAPWPNAPVLIDVAGNRNSMQKPTTRQVLLGWGPIVRQWFTDSNVNGVDPYHTETRESSTECLLSETPVMGDCLGTVYSDWMNDMMHWTESDQNELMMFCTISYPTGWLGWVSTRGGDCTTTWWGGSNGLCVDALGENSVYATDDPSLWVDGVHYGYYQSRDFFFCAVNGYRIVPIIDSSNNKFVKQHSGKVLTRKNSSWIDRRLRRRSVSWMSDVLFTPRESLPYTSAGYTDCVADLNGVPRIFGGAVTSIIQTTRSGQLDSRVVVGATAEIDTHFPNTIEWQCDATFAITANATHTQGGSTPGQLNRNIAYRWLERQVFRDLSMFPDVLVSGGKSTIKLTGDILAIRFLIDGRDITITRNGYDDNTMSAEDRALRVGIADMASHAVALTSSSDNTSKSYTVIDSLTLDIGSKVDAGLIDVEVLLLPDQVEMDHGIASDYPTDIALIFNGGYDVVATSTADGNGDSPSAKTDGAHRMKEALCIADIGLEGGFRLGSIHKATVIPVPKKAFEAASQNVDLRKSLAANWLFIPSDCLIDAGENQNFGLIKCALPFDWRSSGQQLLLVDELGRNCTDIKGFFDSISGLLTIINQFNSFFGLPTVDPATLKQALMQAYGISADELDKGVWWATPNYTAKGLQSPIHVKLNGSDILSDPIKIHIKQPMKIAPPSGSTNRFDKWEAEIVLDDDYFHHDGDGTSGLKPRDRFDAYDADSNGEKIIVDAKFRLLTSAEGTPSVVTKDSKAQIYDVPCFAMKEASGGKFVWKVRFSPPYATVDNQVWECTVRGAVTHVASPDTKTNYDELNRGGTGNAYYHYYGYNDEAGGNQHAVPPSGQLGFYKQKDKLTNKLYDEELPKPRVVFKCGVGANPGPLRVESTQRYFSREKAGANVDAPDRYESVFLIGAARPWTIKRPSSSTWGTEYADIQSETITPTKECGGNVMNIWNASWFTNIVHMENGERWNGGLTPVPAEEWTSWQYYDQARAKLLDGVFQSAEQNNIYVIFSLFDPYDLRDQSGQHTWGRGAYGVSANSNGIELGNGFSGLTANVSEFFSGAVVSNVDIKISFKAYLRYYIARWGYSRSMGMFQPLTEWDGAGHLNSDPSVVAWTDRVMETLRDDSINPYRWPIGISRPWVEQRSSGFASDNGDTPVLEGGSEQFSDYINHHGYFQNINNAPQSVPNELSMYDLLARHLMGWESKVRAQSGNIPLLCGEFGVKERDSRSISGATVDPKEQGYDSEYGRKCYPTYVHYGLWAGMCSGFAGTPMKWSDGKQFGEMRARSPSGDGFTGAKFPYDLWLEYKAIASFVESAPKPRWESLQRNVNVSCTLSGVRVACLSDDDSALGFVFNGNLGIGSDGQVAPAVNSGNVTISGMTGQNYEVCWYNPWTGQPLTASWQPVIGQGGIVTLPLPDFSGCVSAQGSNVQVRDRNDVAFKVRAR